MLDLTLGHKSLKTTQHYAKILDRKVSDDMAVLKAKLQKLSNFNELNKDEKKMI